MIVKIYKIENKKTNALLERIAIALEALAPVPPDTEITEVVVDEMLDSPQTKDESEGLDEIRRSY